MTTFRNSIQDGMKFCCLRQRFHPMKSCKVCTNWGYVSLRNSKPYWNRRLGESSEDIGSQLSEVENLGEKEHGSETSFTKLRRQAWDNWICSRCKESEGNHWCWRRKRYLLPMESEKASVRKETVAVSATMPKIVRKNQNTLPPHLPSQHFHEVEVCRGREVPVAKVTMGPFFDNRADIIWKVPARERLVNIGICPSANSTKMKRVVRLETSVCFFITKLMNNKTKG